MGKQAILSKYYKPALVKALAKRKTCCRKKGRELVLLVNG
jgi:hypothetical protein